MKYKKRVNQLGVLLILSSFLSGLSFPVLANNDTVIIPIVVGSKKPLKNVITVSPKNGDFTDPVAAMDSITDNNANNRYTVVIGPGVYTISSQLVMKPYVGLVGSGRNASVIQGSIASEGGSGVGMVRAASNSSISSMTLVNNIQSTAEYYNVGIYCIDGDVNLSDVKVEVGGGTETIAVYSWNCPEVIESTEIRVTVNGNQRAYGFQSNLSESSRISATKISVNGGLLESVGGHIRNGAPVLSNVDISVTNGAKQYGLFIGGNADVVLSGGRIKVSNGGGDQYGISVGDNNVFTAGLILNGLIMEIDPPLIGGATQYGVYFNKTARSTIANVNIFIGDGPNYDYGIYDGSGTNRIKIDGAEINIADRAVRTDANATSNGTIISNSVFSGGGGVTGARNKCSLVFLDTDDDGTFDIELNSHCGT